MAIVLRPAQGGIRGLKHQVLVRVFDLEELRTRAVQQHRLKGRVFAIDAAAGPHGSQFVGEGGFAGGPTRPSVGGGSGGWADNAGLVHGTNMRCPPAHRQLPGQPHLSRTPGVAGAVVYPFARGLAVVPRVRPERGGRMTQSRGQMMFRWARRVLIGLVALVATAVCAGIAYEQWSRRQVARDFPATRADGRTRGKALTSALHGERFADGDLGGGPGHRWIADVGGCPATRSLRKRGYAPTIAQASSGASRGRSRETRTASPKSSTVCSTPRPSLRPMSWSRTHWAARWFACTPSAFRAKWPASCSSMPPIPSSIPAILTKCSRRFRRSTRDSRLDA